MDGKGRMAALTEEEAKAGLYALKTLHALAEKTGHDGIIRATTALHEHIRRYGEEHHPDVVVMGGDT